MPADKSTKKQVVVIQCDEAVHQVCSGFMCEHAFNARLDAFEGYPEGTRYMSISCGGCPGRATLRKLKNITNNLKKREQRGKEDVMVHLSTCITRSSTHGPRCPNIEYIKGQIERAGYDFVEDSRISPIATKRRAEGMYQ